MQIARMCLAILSILLCETARAQPVTDVELKAGYCLGVASAQYVIENQRALNGTGEKRAHEFIVKGISARRAKFLQYLMMKGFTVERDILLLKPAIDRGRNDVQTCQMELEEPLYKGCDEQCYARFGNDEKTIACSAACPQPNSCAKVKNCLENFLPF